MTKSSSSKSRSVLLSVFLIFLTNGAVVQSFIPTSNLKFLSIVLDKLIDSNSEYAAYPPQQSFTHIDITRLGTIKSVASYFLEKQKALSPNGSHWSHGLRRHVRLEDNVIEKVYNLNIDELYKDYLNEEQFKELKNCDLDLDNAIKVLGESVEINDFDARLKDLPHAHFDAETFVESNRFLSMNLNESLRLIFAGKYADARRQLGISLHTLQDFYSHSNWIEMGNENINKEIGTARFFDNYHDKQMLASLNDEYTCFSENCTKFIYNCSSDFGELYDLGVKYKISMPITCPLVFYKCKNNVVVDKLTSGYYTGQKLENGASVTKPFGKNKCSHGGYLDLTSHENAIGGINKDTAYYFLSPHADLHSKAVNLAIEHTKYFFDQLRGIIGEKHFDNLLQLFHRGNEFKFTCFFHKLFS